MVEHLVSMEPVFKALADPARLRMIETLRSGSKTVTQLAAPLDMTLAGASKHVGVLVRAGLIRQRKRGRERLCSLDPAPLAEAHRWLETYARFWSDRLDDLERELRREP